jgi:hypothetical protein
MKYVFFLAGLLLASRPGLAQPVSAVARPATLAAGPTAPDTVAALHRLYAAKRRKVLPIVAGTVAADALGIAVVGATVQNRGLLDGRDILQGLVGALGVIAVGTEALFYTSSYSRKKEERAIAAYQAHQLPRHLKRQLKARYFLDLPH